MKRILLLTLILILAGLTLSLDLKKDKVQFKKGVVFINKTEWALHEREFASNRDYLKTLDGSDFMSISHHSYLNGKYDANGKALSDHYQELNFYNDEIGTFEIRSYRKQIVRRMNNMQVLSGSIINWENVKEFKTKYSENVSERRFLTK